MTLSRFLRDYLYIPLGGNRKGPVRRHANMFTTMLLGGIWHGAGWTFVVWGALHGAYLIANHGWRELRARLHLQKEASSRAGRRLAQLVTFFAVVIAWVFFRADDMNAALAMLKAMFGVHGVAVPASFAALLPQWPVSSAPADAAIALAVVVPAVAAGLVRAQYPAAHRLYRARRRVRFWRGRAGTRVLALEWIGGLGRDHRRAVRAVPHVDVARVRIHLFSILRRRRD